MKRAWIFVLGNGSIRLVDGDWPFETGTPIFGQIWWLMHVSHVPRG